MTRPVFPIARRTALVLALTSAGILGCEASPEIDSEPAVDLVGQEASFISISGTLTSQSSGRSLDAAQVCRHEDFEAPCAYSDEYGRFTLEGVPANAQITLEITREYFQSTLVPLTTTDADEEWELSLLSEKAVAIQSRRVGVHMEDDSGHLSVRVNEARRLFVASTAPLVVPQDPKLSPVDDVVIRTVPTARFGPAPVELPVVTPGMAGVEVKPIMDDDEEASYADEDGMLLKGQPRTTASGEAIVFNMAAGRRLAAIQAQVTALGCTADTGWIHPSSDQVVVFPIEPGFVTFVTVSCIREL